MRRPASIPAGGVPAGGGGEPIGAPGSAPGEDAVLRGARFPPEAGGAVEFDSAAAPKGLRQCWQYTIAVVGGRANSFKAPQWGHQARMKGPDPRKGSAKR